MKAYIRYSWRRETSRRGSDSDSPANSVANQQDAIQRWLAAHGMEPIADGDWIIDELTSGRTKPLRKREGGRELLRAIKGGERDIIVAHLDRLFRSVVDGLLTLEKWKRQHVHLWMADGVVADVSTTPGWLCTVCLLMVAEWFPRYVGERTSEALLAQQRDGMRVGNIVRFGFQVSPDDPTRTILNPTEQEAIAEIRRLSLGGESLRGICRTLNTNGVQCRGRSGWHHSTVQAILARDE